MPSRKKATLRGLRTTEAHLAHHRERDKAFSLGLKHVESVFQQGLPPEATVQALKEALEELKTRLAVEDRMNQVRLQEIKNTPRFPDEDKDSN